MSYALVFMVSLLQVGGEATTTDDLPLLGPVFFSDAGVLLALLFLRLQLYRSVLVSVPVWMLPLARSSQSFSMRPPAFPLVALPLLAYPLLPALLVSGLFLVPEPKLLLLLDLC